VDPNNRPHLWLRGRHSRHSRCTSKRQVLSRPARQVIRPEARLEGQGTALETQLAESQASQLEASHRGAEAQPVGAREAQDTREVTLDREVEATGVHPAREAEAQVEDQAVPREEPGTAAVDSPRSALPFRPPGKVQDHHRLLPRMTAEEGPLPTNKS